MISVIICSIDDTKYKNITNNYAELLHGEKYEIIGIHDAKSLCEGYNRGIQQSSGSLLIFSHDDIEILSPDFSYKLQQYLETYDVIGVVGTTLLIDGNWGAAGQPYIHGSVAHYEPVRDEYEITLYGNSGLYDSDLPIGTDIDVTANIQAMDGMFFAATRDVVQQVRFDAETFDGFHHYDLDFTYSAYLAGFKLAVCNDISIVHYSRGNFSDAWEHYRDIFRNKYQSSLIRSRKLHPLFTPVTFKHKADVLDFYKKRFP